MQIVAWAGFLAVVGVLLALDLGVFHKDDHVITTKSALRWTFIWFVVAMAFNGAIYLIYENHFLGFGTDPKHDVGGAEAATKFFTGYLVEQSLSIDNLFVIALVFRFFKVAQELQHRVLFWGIIGAVILRVSMILLGAALISRFSFMTYIFGGILLFTAGKMALSKGDDDFDPEDSRIVKIARKLFRISPKMDGHNFFTRDTDPARAGKLIATPLFLVLLVVEGSDVVFAVDSIPAIFGVTTDPFIVFTSNIFAIMGLRSLYFALASLLRDFHYLKYSLIVVLAFVGVKMILAGFHIEIHAFISLGVIVGCLAVGVIASILRKEEEEPEPLTEGAPSSPTEASADAAKADAAREKDPEGDAEKEAAEKVSTPAKIDGGNDSAKAGHAEKPKLELSLTPSVSPAEVKESKPQRESDDDGA